MNLNLVIDKINLITVIILMKPEINQSTATEISKSIK